MVSIDDPKFRKVMKVVSIISVIVLICSALFSLHLIIKYKDHPDLGGTKLNDTEVWRYFQPEKYSLFLEYRAEYGINLLVLQIALVLFFVSGLPIWMDNMRNPKGMFSKWQLELLGKLYKISLKIKKKLQSGVSGED